jgi:Transposase, Mutator family
LKPHQRPSRGQLRPKGTARPGSSSTGDFEEALGALLGKDAGGLSASSIARLKEAWIDEHARWLDRDLSAKRYVYFWVDGIHVQARLEAAMVEGTPP